MQLLLFVGHYVRVVFGNAWGIALGVVAVVNLWEQWFDKKPVIPRRARVWALVAVVVVAQVVAYKQLTDNPPVVLKIPAPPAPTVSAQPGTGQTQSGKPSPPTIQQPTPIGSVAIAPNGIANATPNFGNQTVNNIGPQDRRLSQQQIQDLKSSVQNACSSLPKISVTASNGNQEAQRYAMDFVNALRASGCNADLSLPIPGLTPDVTGVIIGVRNMRYADPLAQTLGKMLGDSMVRFSIAPMKSDFFPTESTVLVIGARE
jgi:hypothetical protein